MFPEVETHLFHIRLLCAYEDLRSAAVHRWRLSETSLAVAWCLRVVFRSKASQHQMSRVFRCIFTAGHRFPWMHMAVDAAFRAFQEGTGVQLVAPPIQVCTYTES